MLSKKFKTLLNNNANADLQDCSFYSSNEGKVIMLNAVKTDRVKYPFLTILNAVETLVKNKYQLSGGIIQKDDDALTCTAVLIDCEQ